MKNWKTTAAGILSALLGMSGPATALVAALQAMKPAPDYTLAIWGTGLTFFFAMLRVWLGLVQNDALTPAQTAQIQLTGVSMSKSGIAVPRFQKIVPSGDYTTGAKPSGDYTTGAKLGAWALIALMLYPCCFMQMQLRPTSRAQSVGLIACNLTPSQIENEINTIVQEATSIIAVADPGVSWLADLTKATALLKVDEANWVKGGAVQDVINVLNDLEGVTALISPLVPYAALIAVLVAGIDAVLALLLPTPAVSGTAAAPAAMSARAAPAANPWKGKATVTSAADSKAQWRAIVAANPALKKAKI